MTSGTSSTTSRSKKATPKLPAQAVVRAPKARIFKIEGEGHILEKIGQWIPKDGTVKAVEIDEACMLDGKRCTAVIFEVPNPRDPKMKQRFALVKADVVLKSTKH